MKRRSFVPLSSLSRPAVHYFSPVRETKEAKVERTKKIVLGLRKAYPDAHCELDHSNPLELLIATILSAQCTDKRVNMVTPDLFKKYRSAADYAKAPAADLENAIKTTGFFRNKTKSIQTCCRTLVENTAARFRGRWMN